jgi:hypothetical protein
LPEWELIVNRTAKEAASAVNAMAANECPGACAEAFVQRDRGMINILSST